MVVSSFIKFSGEWKVSNSKVLVLIPARFDSTRFPGKPLALIDGRSMIQRVYENCLDAKNPSFEGPGKNPHKISFDVHVVTDHPAIETQVLGFGGQVCRVDEPVETGSERIYLSYKRYFSGMGYDLIVNVQGDEPLLTGVELRKLCENHLASGDDIGTLIKKRKGFDQDFCNENLVKVIYSEKLGRCHYFSRAPIPFPRNDEPKKEWFQHIGIYSYKVDALEKFCKAPQSYNEKLESLEQLRALDLGMTIKGYCTEETLIGVDTPEDIQRVEGALRNV